MQHPHFRRTLVSLALLGTGFTAQAADETMTVVGKRCKAWKEKHNRNRLLEVMPHSGHIKKRK